MIVQLLRPEALIVLNIFLFVCVPVSGSVAKSTATSGKVASSDAQAKPKAPSRPAPSKSDAEKAKLKANLQCTEPSHAPKSAPAKDSISALIKKFEHLTKSPEPSQSQVANSAKPLTVSTASSPVSAASQQATSPTSAQITPSSANKANQQRRWSVICALAQQSTPLTQTPSGYETVQASSIDFGASLVPHGNDAETLPASAFN